MFIYLDFKVRVKTNIKIGQYRKIKKNEVYLIVKKMKYITKKFDNNQKR